MVKNIIPVVVLCGLCGLPAEARESQDPTAPLGWQAPKRTQVVTHARLPNLQGIFCDGQACTVVLSGQSVGLGGRVNGYVVSAIGDESVVVSRGGRQWRLDLFAENIKSE